MRSMRKIIILKYIKAKERQAKYKQVRIYLYANVLTNSSDYGRNADNLRKVAEDIKLYRKLLKCLISR